MKFWFYDNYLIMGKIDLVSFGLGKNIWYRGCVKYNLCEELWKMELSCYLKKNRNNELPFLLQLFLVKNKQ